jgi:uncharacterized protein (DUF2141 family)
MTWSGPRVAELDVAREFLGNSPTTMKKTTHMKQKTRGTARWATWRAAVFAMVVIAGCLAAGQTVGEDTASSVVVTIDGFRNPKGHARVAVFNRENGFPDDESRAYRTAIADIRNGRVQVRFDELPAGTYAVSMYHDENDDKKFNKGLFGIPKDGYAVSNNVAHATHAPKFNEALFALTNEVKAISIRVHY